MTTTEERLSRLEGGYEHVATKADIASVRGELKAEIAALRGELKTDIADVRTEIAATRGELKTDIADVKTEVAALRGELKVEMHRLNAKMHRWMYGLLGSIVLTAISGILVGIFT